MIDAAQGLPDAQKHLQLSRETAQGRRNYVIHQAKVERDCKVLQAEGIARMQTALAEGLRRDLGADAPLSAQTMKELLLTTRHFDALQKMAEEDITIMVPLDVGNLGRIYREVRDFSLTPKTQPAQMKI